MPQNAVLLNAHSLAVAEFASKEESRYTLKAVQVTMEEVVATDGSCLVRVDHPQTKLDQFPNVPGAVKTVEAESFLLERDAALSVAKTIPKKTTIPILNHARVGVDEEGNIQAVTTDLETHRPVTIRKVTGQFPNWKRLWPKNPPKVKIGLSANYLAQLAKAAAKYSDRSGYMEISIWDEHSTVRFDAYDSDTNQHWSALLMPMRGEVPNRPFAWAEAAEPEPPADPFADVPEPSEEMATVAVVAEEDDMERDRRG
jgi:hypothetical protein